jgi:pimeloyl-ACP methyl ester carboxylesterase
MNERLIQFGPGDGLIGTVTLPEATAGAAPVAFLFFNAGFMHRVGPHRMNVRLARFLARHGYPSARFDFSGLGDSVRSHGNVEQKQRVLGEIEAAMNATAAQTGAQRFILVGLCSGTDACLWAGMENSRVVGTVLLDPFAYKTWRTSLNYLVNRIRKRGSLPAAMVAGVRSVAWTIRTKLRRPKAAVRAEEFIVRPLPTRQEFERWIGTGLSRGVRMLVLYTGNFPNWYNYADQFTHRHGTFGNSPLLTHGYIPEANHTFTELALQKKLFERVLAWTRTFA